MRQRIFLNNEKYGTIVDTKDKSWKNKKDGNIVDTRKNLGKIETMEIMLRQRKNPYNNIII